VLGFAYGEQAPSRKETGMICTNLPPVIELVVWWSEREKSGNHLAGGTDMPVFTFPWTPTEDWAFTYRSMNEARWDAFDRRVLN
jgi:hypothetical protein